MTKQHLAAMEDLKKSNDRNEVQNDADCGAICNTRQRELMH